jgi:hypothetical protein
LQLLDALLTIVGPPAFHPAAVVQSMAFIQHCRSMKEAGFNPKMVYRNLPPSHLYEKVRFPGCGCQVSQRSVRESSKSFLPAAHWPDTCFGFG